MQPVPSRGRGYRQAAAGWAVTFVLCALAATAAGVAEAADPEAGRRLAQEWCSSCHYVEGGRAASDAAPAFAEIANRPDATPEGWEAWLADPHPPMPNFSLSREETKAIIDFLQSLRD